jgi:hypothetical protein
MIDVNPATFAVEPALSAPPTLEQKVVQDETPRETEGVNPAALI